MTNAEYEKLCVTSARKTTKEVAADGDLAKYSNGEYIGATTNEFFNCWNAALETK